MVQRPDLFASVYCGVPLLDLLRYTEFILGKVWTVEFGDPASEDEFHWIYPSSPYHNVIDGISYPAVLFYTALSDNRTHPSHALKMAARVQCATSAEISDHPVLLRIDRQAGHGYGLSIETLVEIRTNQIIFHAKHTGLDLE
jgi:prolyl oligopeptidase